MSRSLKKAPYVEEKLFNRIVAMNEKGEKKVLKTWSRSSTIFPEFVGHTIAVHDGRKHVPVYVIDDMVGQAWRVRTHAHFQGTCRFEDFEQR